MADVPAASKWNGLWLILDERTNPGEYVVTDAAGYALSGGNIFTGRKWKNHAPGAGQPACVRAGEEVIKELRREHAAGIRPQGEEEAA